MADEKDKDPKKPPLPPGLPPLPGGGGAKGKKPSLPPLPGGSKKPVPPHPPVLGGGPAASQPPAFPPGFPSAGGGGRPQRPAPGLGMPSAQPPAPPHLGPAAPQPGTPPYTGSALPDPDRKIAELEKRLQSEREKVLLANLKSQEEKTIAARVETSIKEIQDKLRRDRRDAEQEESRLKLESQLKEMEGRLAQERETWVATLQGQMQTRETADKEIEAHFTMRIQEMERRWLEEKAHWQRIVTGKEEELRKARSELERLAKVDTEREKVLKDNEILQEKVTEFSKSNASLQARVNAGEEREKDYFRVKAELDKTTEQLRYGHERFERDLHSLRDAAREREQRLAADNERLQNELGTVSQRIRAEYEAETRRTKAEHDAEIKKARAHADLATAALQRMRAVGGALEKQVAALRVQAEEAKKLKNEVQRVNDRYKAEFLVLQRKWQDRENEIRKQAETAFESRLQKEVDTARSKLKLRAQEELQNRVLAVQEQLRKELEGQIADREKAIRTEMERELAERTRRVHVEMTELRRKLEGEIERKSADSAKSEDRWREKLLKKEAELASLRSSLDDTRGRLTKEEEWKQQAAQDKIELEKDIARAGEKVRALDGQIGEMKTKLGIEQKKVAELTAENHLLEGLRDADKERKALLEEKEATLERIAKMEAEYIRKVEIWRRRVDLVKRDFESKVRSVEVERDDARRALAERAGPPSMSIMDRIRRLFGRKPKAPEAAAPPVKAEAYPALEDHAPPPEGMAASGPADDLPAPPPAAEEPPGTPPLHPHAAPEGMQDGGPAGPPPPAQEETPPPPPGA